MGAVAALAHDVLFILGMYSIFYSIMPFSLEIDQAFIAAILTIIGYSINDTVVIFDRIRENLKFMKKNDTYADIVNLSITQTLTRSIYTSFTTLVMVAVLYILGVSSIREFALPLMVGILCGGYSSVCITGPLWYVMKTKIGKNK